MSGERDFLHSGLAVQGGDVTNGKYKFGLGLLAYGCNHVSPRFFVSGIYSDFYKFMVV